MRSIRLSGAFLHMSLIEPDIRIKKLGTSIMCAILILNKQCTKLTEDIFIQMYSKLVRYTEGRNSCVANIAFVPVIMIVN